LRVLQPAGVVVRFQGTHSSLRTASPAGRAASGRGEANAKLGLAYELLHLPHKQQGPSKWFSCLRGEATALVHEAYLRLVGGERAKR
jgi:hypothetical protein